MVIRHGLLQHKGSSMLLSGRWTAALRLVAISGLAVGLTACGSSGTSVTASSDACAGLSGTSGSVRKVKDGDTFRLAQSSGDVIDVRLDQIDAPEKAQPWSNRSREQLRELLSQGDVCVVGTKHDKYGRLLGEVHVNGTVVNTEMVRLGAAWAYRHYLRDSKLLDLEADARTNKRGLWSMPAEQTLAPWEFRHPELAQASQVGTGQNFASLISSPHLAAECGAKPSCRQMSSCDEATSWLAKCGGQGIDGDGDGIPCEKICAPEE